MVPGQVITKETIDFMRKLDVKEIHGYHAAEGLEADQARGAGGAKRKQKALRCTRKLNLKSTHPTRKEQTMMDWFFATLKQYPEIAIFLALALGYYFGKFTYKGIGLGAVTATLIAGVVIGQIGITISQPLKAFVFLMFLFAVGYAVGPQFVRGHCQGRPAAGDLRGGPVRVQPGGPAS